MRFVRRYYLELGLNIDLLNSEHSNEIIFTTAGFEPGTIASLVLYANHTANLEYALH